MPHVISESQIFTYQTRPTISKESQDTLSAIAGIMSPVEKKLFADLAKGKQASALKSGYLKEYGITARHFNAIRIQLEGKIASITELRKGQIEEDKRR